MKPYFMIRHIEPASVQVLEQLEAEYESSRCVCGTEKWPRFPFCRLCSIALQRINCMAFLKAYAGVDWLRWPPHMVRVYFITMDVCRDYLVNRKRRTA